MTNRIFLIDSISTQFSHSAWMTDIIKKFNPTVNLVLIELPVRPLLNDIFEIVEHLKMVVTPDDLVLCAWQVKKNIAIDTMFAELSALCTIVTAAGNAGDDISHYSPTNIEEVITVGCLNKSGHIATLSNTSADKPMKWVCGTNFNIGERCESGTSVSVAIYAALLALANHLKDPDYLVLALSEYSRSVLAEIN